ncbi:hypothetical protein OLN68_09540 [Citrobacter freundii]|nr:hypothetical protein [Citrobacter freundii]MCW1445895.1 hypothetical protein [Citrobacter freundii]
MKERGMIFNAEMVRAILDGRKTQTRRPANASTANLLDLQRQYPQKKYNISCPFGDVGDRIWVRETWATLGNEDGCCVDWNDNLCKGDEREAARIYRASCEQRPGDYGLWSIPDNAYWKPHTENEKFEGAWRPSIHMPRWASRITLEITSVRVERLSNISQADAKAEGYPSERAADGGSLDPWLWFRGLWDGIYPDQSFKVNPWVWVVEFKRVEGGAA